MIVAHDEECPAICGKHVLTGLADSCDFAGCNYHCSHRKHACTCTAEAKLRELVEAAEWALSDLAAADKMDGVHPPSNLNWAALDAALVPFRGRA